jgi:ABC transporter substrate binding protein
MRRREFITLLGGTAATWPLATRAQQPDRMRRIGVLMPATAGDAEYETRVGAFLQELAQLGWSIGRNVRIDTRWAGANAAEIRKHAAELAALAPKVILVNGVAAVGPLLQVTRAVPIVFVAVADPVAAGFVDSLARPGGNATGFTALEYSFGGKWLNALSSLYPGRAVKELVCGRPAQDQRGRLRGVDARRHAGQVAGPERAIGGVRPEYRQIGHPVANLKAAYAPAELIDFPDDVIAQHERRTAGGSLRVEVAPDHHVGVLHARGEHADPHLAPASRRQGSVDHLQLVDTAEAPELNNPVARLPHGRIPCNS